MRKWDDDEKRDSNREEFNRKIGKFMLIYQGKIAWLDVNSKSILFA